jgi:WD40 repeat protein
VLGPGDSPPLVHSVAFSPDGRTLASGVGNFIRLWEVVTGKEIVTLKGHEGLVVINSVAFSPDGRTLASGSGPSSFMDNGEERCIRLWDVRKGKAIRAWGGHSDGVTSVAFAPDGKTLVSGGDQGVLVWKNPAAKPSGK